jgi:hypothetical protein
VTFFVSGVASNKKKVSARKKILDSDDEKTETGGGGGGEAAERTASQDMTETEPTPGPSGLANTQVRYRATTWNAVSVTICSLELYGATGIFSCLPCKIHCY